MPQPVVQLGLTLSMIGKLLAADVGGEPPVYQGYREPSEHRTHGGNTRVSYGSPDDISMIKLSARMYLTGIA